VRRAAKRKTLYDILKTPSMPIASPTYPRGPYRFINREYFITTYESDPDAIRQALPEPLEPDGSNTVLYEFVSLPDSSGFGTYTQTGIVIPCLYKGEAFHHVSQMYLDCEPPISGGREVWGFPQKFAKAKFHVIHDTLTGKLEYSGQTVAIATMGYKHENLIIPTNTGMDDAQAIEKKLAMTRVNLKLIPHVDGSMAIAQLVAYNMTDIRVKGAWAGPARLQLHAHVNAPVADLPVKKVRGGAHFIVDITLPYGRMLYDYLGKTKDVAKSA
jgi:acetoacetate decarboxylase